MDPEDTPLDTAYAAMEADPGDEAARLRFHERVLDAELFLLLDAEPEGDRLRPRVLDLPEGRFVLAFDRDARLAAFLDAPAPYAAIAGRKLVRMLAGQGVGIALNPGVAPSETALEPDAVDWLAAMAPGAPEVADGRAREISAPRTAPPALIVALDAKLAAMADRISAAWLAGLHREDGTVGLALAIAGAPEAAQAAIVEAVAETARFNGAAALDVTFVGPDGPLRAAFERAGLRFEMPEPPSPPPPPPAPGSDPTRPPRLRPRG